MHAWLGFAQGELVGVYLGMVLGQEDRMRRTPTCSPPFKNLPLHICLCAGGVAALAQLRPSMLGPMQQASTWVQLLSQCTPGLLEPCYQLVTGGLNSLLILACYKLTYA